MYSAARITTKAETIAATGLVSKAPMKTRISETKGERPGSDSADRPATRKVPASTGVTLARPPRSAMFRDLPDGDRRMMNPAMRNSSPVEIPWLNM